MGNSGVSANPSEIAPYFDILFQRMQDGEPRTCKAFGRHVHWGYWPHPEQADGTPEDYAVAAERLCQLVCDAAGIQDGMRVLDVGCGLGGTIASLNERFEHLDLVGLNIDPRQLAWAEQRIKPARNNRIRWVEGDACRLSYDGAFDAVLAVECIFHFPSRHDFFAGAARALVPGGKLALSDLAPPAEYVHYIRNWATIADTEERQTYGQYHLTFPLEEYRTLAEQVGLTQVELNDINAGTMPTYPFLMQDLDRWDDQTMAQNFGRSTKRLQTVARLGVLRYAVLSFVK